MPRVVKSSMVKIHGDLLKEYIHVNYGNCTDLSEEIGYASKYITNCCLKGEIRKGILNLICNIIGKEPELFIISENEGISEEMEEIVDPEVETVIDNSEVVEVLRDIGTVMLAMLEELKRGNELYEKAWIDKE